MSAPPEGPELAFGPFDLGGAERGRATRVALRRSLRCHGEKLLGFGQKLMNLNNAA